MLSCFLLEERALLPLDPLLPEEIEVGEGQA